MKTLLASACLLSALIGASAQTLPPGKYHGQVNPLRGHQLNLHLTVWEDGTLSTALVLGNPNTDFNPQIIQGEGTNKPNGVVRGQFSGRGTWRGRVSEEGSSATVRVYLRRGLTARFHLRPIPPPPAPGGSSGGAIIRFPPLTQNPPVIVAPQPPPAPLEQPPLPPPPPPLVPITPPSGAVIESQRRIIEQEVRAEYERPYIPPTPIRQAIVVSPPTSVPVP